MFIALMFLPMMRWLKKHRVPKTLNIIIVILIITAGLKTGGFLIQITSREILGADSSLWDNAIVKMENLLFLIEDFFGIRRIQDENIILHYLPEGNLMNKFGSTIDFVGNTLSMTLMTLFFTILWLAESVNFQQVLNFTILKQKYSSVKVFMKIEQDLIKFVIVKFIISLLTGAGFTIACLLFDVPFPIFWGLLTFALNFVQMIGSFISTIVVALFALIQVDPNASWLFFVITLTLIQVFFGGIIEPVFMGKSFSINVITILIMLMFWGFLWGVPGMIMSIPITVFLKIILEQFPRTKVVALLMKGPEKPIPFPSSKKRLPKKPLQES
jgi:predicted PurR-regulated permease PerM